MRFVLPTQYKATFVERGKRSEKHAIMLGEAMVTIRDIPPGEAVLVLVGADVSGDEPRLSPRGGRPRRVLSWGGAFWRELMPEAEFRGVVEHRWDEVEEEAWREVRHDNPFAAYGSSVCTWVPGVGTTTRAEVENGHGPLRVWEDDGGRAMAQAAQLRANDLVAVGGVVYERCHEPCWRVWRADGEVVVGLGFAVPERDREANAWGRAETPEIYREHRFVASRGRDAEAFARSWAALVGAGRVRVAAKAELRDPSAVSLPDDSLSLVKASKEALEQAAGTLNSVPRAAGRAWYALRDAFERAGGDATVELGDALAAFAEEWLPGGIKASRRVDTSAYGEDGYTVAGEHGVTHMPGAYAAAEDTFLRAVRAAKLAADRWAARPDDGREWAHLGGDRRRFEHDGVLVRELTTLAAVREAAAAIGAAADDEAAMAADGKVRLFSAAQGARVVGIGVADADGTVLRTLGPGGRGAAAAAVAAFDALRGGARDALRGGARDALRGGARDALRGGARDAPAP
jgi:hypothetical protein